MPQHIDEKKMQFAVSDTDKECIDILRKKLRAKNILYPLKIIMSIVRNPAVICAHLFLLITDIKATKNF